MSKHLDFYYKCLEEGEMPHAGLCLCDELINEKLLNLFVPYGVYMYESYWAGEEINPMKYEFTPLRQNIVLLMACLNGEL